MKKNTIVLLSAALVMGSCAIVKQQPLPSIKGFDFEAHRGGRGLMPENTIAAMKNAIDYQHVTTLELDVVISGDQQVVVSHDPIFNHLITTTPSGGYLTSAETQKLFLYNLSYDSIRRYDVGLKPHKDFVRQKKIAAYKPTLSALIDSVEAYASLEGRKFFYNIEIKSKPELDNTGHPEPEVFVSLVYNVLQQKKILDRVVLQSFDERALQQLHRKYPAVPLSFLVDKNGTALDEQLTKLGFTPGIYSPVHTAVTKELVNACHNKNMRIVPWTVNNLADMQRLVDLGVDGVISDYPDIFSQVKIPF